MGDSFFQHIWLCADMDDGITKILRKILEAK